METLAHRLSSFVSDNLPGASLPPPRFESLPYLRFELGGELAAGYGGPIGVWFDLPGRLSRRRRRIEQAVSRATALFELAILPGHRGFLDAYVWPADEVERESEAETQLLGLLPDAARSSVGFSDVADFWGEGLGDGRAVVRLTAALELRQLDYRALFRLIANDELGIEPSVGARVYLVDETDPLVFLMYDDRGAIVHARTPDRLRLMYETANPWLVEHDRPAMGSLFGRRGG